MSYPRQHEPRITVRSIADTSGSMTAILFLVCLVVGTMPASAGQQTRDATGSVRLRIAVTGNLDGRIWPSWDCIGQELGGLARRFTFVRMLRETPEAPDTPAAPLLLLDAGGLFGDQTQFPERYAEFYMTALNYMQYDAFNLGPAELRQGDAVLARMGSVANFPLLSNAHALSDDGADTPWRPYAVKTVNGLRVGVIGVTTPPDPGRTGEANNDIAALVKQVRDKADVVILLARMEAADILELLETAPGVDIAAAEELIDMQGGRFRETLLAGFLPMGKSVTVLDLFWNADEKKIDRLAALTYLLDDSLADDDAIFAMTATLNENIDRERETAREHKEESDARQEQEVREMVGRALQMTPEEFFKHMDRLMKQGRADD